MLSAPVLVQALSLAALSAIPRASATACHGIGSGPACLAAEASASGRKMEVVFDFDKTITQSDTIETLVQSALAWHRERGSDLSARWEECGKLYMEDYEAYVENYTPAKEDRTTLAAERAYLQGLHEIDDVSVDRVSASGIFAGLSKETLFQFGVAAAQNGNVTLQPGFHEFVTLAESRGWKTQILSINWSSAFIRGVLHPLDIKVTSNDPSCAGKIKGPKFLGKGLTSSVDKLKALEHIVSLPSAERVVYFGDSATDMECLLEKGGVVIAKNAEASLLQTLQRIGREASHASVHSVAGGGRQPPVVWARDYDEIIKARIFA